MFIAAALFAVALMIFAARAIKTGEQIGAFPLPAADLDAISSFLSPLPAPSSGRTPVGNHDIVIERDPFLPAGVASSQVRAATGRGATPVKPTSKQPWVVSTIMIEGVRRSAIVNDEWVNVGDPLTGGSRLTAVEPDHIVVTDAKGIRHRVPIQGGEPW